MRARQAFARTSPKVSGRSLGTCQEITRGRPLDSPLEKSEVAGLRDSGEEHLGGQRVELPHHMRMADSCPSSTSDDEICVGQSRRAFASIIDGAPKDIPKELALRDSRLVPLHLSRRMDLTLEEESEEVILTCLKRELTEGARQSKDERSERAWRKSKDGNREE
ncbi:hypothetical protein B296_00027851 [Ensete ventricosum]|uniref:Uncharacterized protein n=1 Tax=Ensete ventricosum TaxID=4639 RepID=A0A427AGP0_ENSVE|nr:hypothetical protein B296_00027851 [Ensete ventricosum]